MMIFDTYQHPTTGNCEYHDKLIYTVGEFIRIFFLWREILILLTAKWIVLAVIDFETYGPNISLSGLNGFQ